MTPDEVLDIEQRVEHLDFFEVLDEVRQSAVVELAFVGMLFTNPKLVACLRRGDYEEAAVEVLDGPWKDQRATIVAHQIATGEWST